MRMPYWLLAVVAGCGAAPDSNTLSDGGVVQSTDAGQVVASAAIDVTGKGCNQSAVPSTDSQAPDLAVDRINGSLSYDSTSGDLKIGFSFGNVGKSTAGPYLVGIFLYPDITNRCRAYYVSQFSRPGLEVNGLSSGVATTNLKKLDPPLPSGGYEVGYVLDVESQLPEALETNNFKALGTINVR